jgi:hypothetical protein
MAEAETGFLSSALVAGAHAGLEIEGLAMRPEEELVQIHWRLRRDEPTRKAETDGSASLSTPPGLSGAPRRAGPAAAGRGGFEALGPSGGGRRRPTAILQTALRNSARAPSRPTASSAITPARAGHRPLVAAQAAHGTAGRPGRAAAGRT